jgi:ubiquinone biosynthesis protein COQ9
VPFIQAFALLATPDSGIPPFDLRPAVLHASRIADDACYITGDTSAEVRFLLFA